MTVGDKKVTYKNLVEQNRINTTQMEGDLTRKVRIIGVGACIKGKGYLATNVVIEGTNTLGRRFSSTITMEELLCSVMSGKYCLLNETILRDWGGWGLI